MNEFLVNIITITVEHDVSKHSRVDVSLKCLSIMHFMREQLNIVLY